MRSIFVATITAIGLGVFGDVAKAMESDQFLTWGVELRDSADALNAYFNQSVVEFVDRINREDDCSCEEATLRLFHNFFKDHRNSVIRTWIKESGQVDLYPPMSVTDGEYRRESVYRGARWPFFVPVSRTVRIGDVYLGLDKIGHMFGFGGRYYERYLRHRKEGYAEGEAMEKIIRWGIHSEETYVGKWADGVFSHGDLEANFQGFKMARAFCEGESRYLANVDGKWTLARPIDWRDHVTPGLDESFNLAHHWPGRRGSVMSIIAEDYCGKLPLVEARFARYEEVLPSFSQEYIEKHFAERGGNPQEEQGLGAICGASGGQQAD